MQMCWNKNPEQRPVSFELISEKMHTTRTGIPNRYNDRRDNESGSFFFVAQLGSCKTMEVVRAFLEEAMSQPEASRNRERERETITKSVNSILKRSQIVTFTKLAVERKIDMGSYGKVFLGQWNAALVALKFCRKKGNLEDFM
jgi:hypothetical protein